ncbi:hypothetical protein Q7P37_000978 [Cladosporium fusiforme]
MARFSIKTFLSHAKRQLAQASQNGTKTSFVVGNESADLDSITSAILYGYIQSSTPQALRSNTLTIPLTNIPSSDLSLRPELTTLLKHANLTPSDLITLDDLPANATFPSATFTLVDHNALTGPLASKFPSPSIITACIDHHEDEATVPTTATPRLITKSGSCASLIATHLHDPWVNLALFSSSTGAANGQQSYEVIDDTAYTSTWDAQAALLALGAILIDTQNLTSSHKVTPHDTRAVKLLEAFIAMSPRLGPSYDREAFYASLDAAKADISPLSVRDILRKDYKEWSEKPNSGDAVTLGVASVVQNLSFMEEKASRESNEKEPQQTSKPSHAALLRASASFARERNLDVFAIMTAFTDSSGSFARELLLLTLNDGPATEAAKRFAAHASAELNLVEMQETGANSSEVGVAWTAAWKQEKLEASRKQVAPLLREALRG